jgi:hypothetical protein
MKTRLLLTIASSMVFAISVFAQPLTPFAYFPFDSNFTDVMGAVIATTEGDVTIVTDSVRGGVASFPGGTGSDPHWIRLSDTAWGMPAVTYCMWFKLNSVNTWARLFQAGTQAAYGGQPEVWLAVASDRTNGALCWSIDFDHSGGPEFPGEVLVVDTWYHVCFGLDDISAKLWMNGELVADSLHNMGSLEDDVCPDIYLGKSVWPADPLLNGYIDDFKIYNELLFDRDVEDIYNTVSVIPVMKPVEPTIYTSNGRIYIRDADNFNIHSVKIFNIAGQLVYQTNDHVRIIDANLPISVYIVSIDSDRGSFKRKIVLR